MPFAPELRSHSQKVCTLYKKAMRLIESYYVARSLPIWLGGIIRSSESDFDCSAPNQDMECLFFLLSCPISYTREAMMKTTHAALWYVVRYHQVVLRCEFDKNRAVCDPKEQRRLLWLGEDEVFMKMNPVPPMKFPRSYGICAGVAQERVVDPPDWILDYWHPLEKAQYPSYFATREKRKIEYIKYWKNGVLM